MPPLELIESRIQRLSQGIGRVSAVLLLLLLANVFYDVVMRYLLNDVSIGMQELEWHLYASLFLLGISYTMSQDGHVRVDLIYDQLSAKRRSQIDIVGTIFLLIPFCLLITWYGMGFVAESYQLGESSGDPGGLPYRWLIKAMIPLSFLLLLISSVGFMLRSWRLGQEGGA
ncbi:MAG: TRAP transporter small permease subunit [Gammaproteobacteria bacterium]|uniref:TRAP transporter small permease protein n=1 Tax=Candidatus Thiopontia autotrophica TaxID=2841688 RepID=A0A8J6TMS6_9GAMM|nr:TRAP transporter small permease subunit [Candidatus Thiopontia autotrophica]MBL6968988.1 TRAP transporter small permease subunit [Gammaproteobacteria bacterium]